MGHFGTRRDIKAGVGEVAEVSISQAAAILGVSVDTIRRRAKRGELVATMDGTGRYSVILDESQAVPRSAPIQDTHTAALEAENATLKAEVKRLADLLGELRRQRDMLQQQVDDLRQYRQDDAEAQHQLRQLILALTAKVPQIEGPDPQAKRGWWPFKR